MKIIGVDENGYGPVMGPLVVTGVCVEIKRPEADRVKNDVFHLRKFAFGDLKESKSTFSKTGAREKAAHLLFEASNNLAHFVVLPSPSLKNCSREEASFCISPQELCSRVWDLFRSTRMVASIDDCFSYRGVVCALVCPRDFNAYLRQEGKKSRVLVRVLDEIVSSFELDGETLVVCDNLGGTKHYSRVFPEKFCDEHLGQGYVQTQMILSTGRTVPVLFAVRGDQQFPIVALASNIGKLMREIAMDALNEGLARDGWKGKRVSGYRDIFTRGAVRFLRERPFSTECLFRAR